MAVFFQQLYGLAIILIFSCRWIQVVDATLDSESSQEDDNSLERESNHHLEIFPESPLVGHALFKRVDDTLNLTCRVVKDSGPSVKFALEWHLPQNVNNRINKQTKGSNTLQLLVKNIQESDSGKYSCEARGDGFFLRNYTMINVKPKKGMCSETMFLCPKSRSCIHLRYLCDGVRDCIDGSDESTDHCGESPCENKIQCEDGRCIAKQHCCDRFQDANCSTTYDIPCCNKLRYLVHEFPIQNQRQYNDIGFLQSTMYTIIGCSVAFVLIVTFTVIAVCRVHMKRSALSSTYATYRTDPRVWGDLDSYLITNSRWNRGILRPEMNRSSGVVLHPYGVGDSTSNALLVTYNINNGVQLMGRPMEPPPYEEVASQPSREEPPPPYASRENLNPPQNSSDSHWFNRPVNHTPFLSTLISLLVNNPQAEGVDEDNNNGDINGNNTGQVRVRPDSNRTPESISSASSANATEYTNRNVSSRPGARNGREHRSTRNADIRPEAVTEEGRTPSRAATGENQVTERISR